MSDLTPPAGQFDDAPVHGEVISPPVTTRPSDNPFAVATADHINAGAVAIESSRGIAEVQGRMVLAKRFPRDSAMAYSRAMTSCLRIGLAKEGIYKYNRGGSVEGPSIRLAEELARAWGNIEYGLNELSRKHGESEMEAFAWDLETNVRSSQRFTVRHIRDRNEGGKALETERDIYEITANMGARRMRSRILAILPPELVRDAVAQCKETMRKGGGEPLEDRIKKMMAAFNHVGVTPAMIADRLEHPIDRITPDELVDLAGIYQSLKDNQSKVKDWFGPKKTAEPPPNADAFEAASAGKPAEPPKDEKPDPDATHATDLVAQFQRCATQAEITALSSNAAVKRTMAKWKDGKPELFAQVSDAAAARWGELEPAATREEPVQ